MKTIIKYLGCVLMLLAVTKASVPLYACAHCCEPTGGPKPLHSRGG